MRALPKLAAVAALALLTLTGCAATVPLQPAAHATSAGCANVIVHLPDTAANLAQRQTNAQGTSAWGTPANLLLRCGVAVPDPTSTLECVTVEGIDWLVDNSESPNTVFTTYGRSPAVEVIINGDKVDGASALGDIATAVSVVKAKHHCTTPSETIQGGKPVDPTTSPPPSPTP